MHPDVLTKPGTEIFLELAAFADFYLAGGTALALQIGHRVSVDFDFFSDAPIPRALFSRVKRVFDGNIIEPLINDREELTVLVDGVKLTFLYYPFPVVTPLLALGQIRALSIAEIGATKAYTVGRRGSFKDYIDLYFILKENYASLDGLIDLASQKYGRAFNSRLFLEQLLFIDDLEDYKIEFVHEPVAPSEILSYFRNEIKRVSIARAA